jgi:hypothetical protein
MLDFQMPAYPIEVLKTYALEGFKLSPKLEPVAINKAGSLVSTNAYLGKEEGRKGLAPPAVRLVKSPGFSRAHAPVVYVSDEALCKNKHSDTRSSTLVFEERRRLLSPHCLSYRRGAPSL